MWAGQPINVTEHRAVMHMAPALSGRQRQWSAVENVMPGVREVLDRMRDFSADVRSGAIRGATGKPFTDVVNIGIGGSDLGPAMVTLALEPYTRADLRGPLRLQCRWRPSLRHDEESRHRVDAVRRRVQDLHHRRDHDQCPYGRAGC